MQGGLTGYVGARLISWYLLSVLPLLVITPVLVLLYDLPLSSLKVLLPSLAIGTACLNLLGAIGKPDAGRAQGHSSVGVAAVTT